MGEGRREERGAGSASGGVGVKLGEGGYSQSDVLPNAGILACRGKVPGAPNTAPGHPVGRGTEASESKETGSPGSPKNPRALASALSNNLELDGEKDAVRHGGGGRG